MLCAVCLCMLHDGLDSGPHHTCLGNLIKAAEGGCRICTAFTLCRERMGPDLATEATARPLLHYQFAEKFSPRARTPKFRSDVSWLNSGAPTCRIIEVLVSEEVDSIPEWYFEAVKHAVDDRLSQPWRVRKNCYPHREIPSNTGHEAVLGVAKSWIENCERDHDCEEQNGTEDSAWCPKRLIDLSDPAAPRLLETALERPSDRYATLSHCWGPEPRFLTLTQDNLDSFRQGIPVNSLPRSFVDAIFACHHLGIQYLWIDSLCILQDSEADWLLHTKEMTSVYANCRLNLSFDAAPCPEVGGFRERNTDQIQECDVFFLDPVDIRCHKNPRRLDGPAEMTKIRRYTIYCPEGDFMPRRWISPLSSRGWVLQEGLMSPRVLHFKEDRISWNCTAVQSLNEALPRGPAATAEAVKIFKTHGDRSSKSSHEGDLVGLLNRFYERFNCPRRERGLDAYKAWVDIVNDYSRRILTYPDKDKLVALAAVAQRFSSALGDDYYAGHFGINMPFDLVWAVDQTYSRSRPTRRRPTWSWASVDSGLKAGPIAIEGLVATAVVEGVRVSLVDPAHKYGQVNNGELLIRCFLVPCTLTKRVIRVGLEHWTVLTSRDLQGHPIPQSILLEVYLDEPEKPIPDNTHLAPLFQAVQVGRQKTSFGMLLGRQSEEAYTRYGAWVVLDSVTAQDIPLSEISGQDELSEPLLVKII